MWQLKKLLNRENFNNINEGKSTFRDIEEINSYTTIIEKSKESGVSEHKLKNNEVVIIDYIKKNKVWTVEKINFISIDPSKFTSTLIPEDLLI